MRLIFTDQSLWPSEATWSNYAVGWKAIRNISFERFYLNSFIISGLSVAGTLISCFMAAYAFARLDFTFRKIWFALMLLTIMLPGHVTLIPQCIMFHKLSWVGSIWPLVIPRWLALDSFYIFLMIQFICGLPRDLDESAKMDGCGPFQIFFFIMLPLSVPALITTAIFTFISSWEDFFSQLLYLNKPESFTVPLGLRLFLDSAGESMWGPLFAMPVFGNTAQDHHIFLFSEILCARHCNHRYQGMSVVLIKLFICKELYAVCSCSCIKFRTVGLCKPPSGDFTARFFALFGKED
jgi:multiple sugar transport system permease protein